MLKLLLIGIDNSVCRGKRFTNSVRSRPGFRYSRQNGLCASFDKLPIGKPMSFSTKDVFISGSEFLSR